MWRGSAARQSPAASGQLRNLRYFCSSDTRVQTICLATRASASLHHSPCEAPSRRTMRISSSRGLAVCGRFSATRIVARGRSGAVLLVPKRAALGHVPALPADLPAQADVPKALSTLTATCQLLASPPIASFNSPGLAAAAVTCAASARRRVAASFEPVASGLRRRSALLAPLESSAQLRAGTSAQTQPVRFVHTLLASGPCAAHQLRRAPRLSAGRRVRGQVRVVLHGRQMRFLDHR